MSSETALTLTLKLHGRAAVQFADGREQPLEGRSAALVALVALEPDARREKVASLLWPESEDPRRNLRQQLLRLRAALGGAELVQGENQLRLAPEVTLAPQTSHSEAAAPLLGSLTFPDCPDFQAWLEAHRLQQRTRDVQSLLAKASAAEAESRYDEALTSAQRLLGLDECSEAHHRLVMRLHYLRGDRSAGLAAFDRLQRWLHARYGFAPDAESQALARTLRDSSSAPVAPRPAALATPVTMTRPPRLIGRDDALAALRAAWEGSRAALVLGEPGLGKSRLMGEFCTGVHVAWAAGRPGDQGVPYATLARLLRSLRELHEPVCTSAEAAALACVLPEGTATPTALDAGHAATTIKASPVTLSADTRQKPNGNVRLTLLAALDAWLVQAQAQGLAAVVLDDLHFADAATIEAMQTLIGSESLARLRFVLAARPGEIGAAGEALRDALAEARTLDEIALEPLTVEQMTALVASLGLAELDAAALGPQLARHCGGNPLYALETLKLGLADGTLHNGRLPSPQGVGALIERRLKQLAAPALTLARVAAVAGVDFDIDLAESVTGRNAVDLADAWSQLDAAQVLRDGAFAHDLVYDAALRTIPKPIARRLHEQCASHLAARGGEPARLAAHWMAAGRVRESAEAFLDAAERARRAGRSVEEAAFLAQAAQAFAAAGDATRRFEVLTQRLAALSAADFGTEADLTLEELQMLAIDDRQRLRIMRERLQLFINRGQLAQAIEHGPEALTLARSLADTPEQVRITCLMSGALSQLGRGNEAHDLLQPLARWVRESAPADLLGFWLGYWASALRYMHRLREAVAVHEEYHALAVAHGLPPTEVSCNLNDLSVTCKMMGRSAQAISASQRAVQVLQEDPHAKGTPLLNKLNLAGHLSDHAHYAEALALFDEALPAVERSAGSAWVFAARNWLGGLWLCLGQYARAAPLLAPDDEDMPVGLRVPRLALRSQLMEATHQPGARALLEQASAMAPGEGHLLTRILETWIQPAEDSLRLAPRWIELAQRLERYGVVLQGWAVLARAASKLGEHARAADAARRALALLADGICPKPMYHVEAWLIAADALRAAGHAEEADAAIGAGMQWLQRHAMPHVPPVFVDSFLNRNPHNCALLRGGRSIGRNSGGGHRALE